MNLSELKDFLDEKVEKYNTPQFIDEDPIQIPHSFSLKEDIEISGFLAATIAWGKRGMIIKNARQMCDLMGNSPYDFVMNASDNDLEELNTFKHRTFNGHDFVFFVRGLRHLYKNCGGLENSFVFGLDNFDVSIKNQIVNFRRNMLQAPHLERSEKHISSPDKGSAAKRINMYLRWMCRQDNKGVDFGIWKSISPSLLKCPLDVHTGNVARKLGLLTRKQNDWKAIEELGVHLSAFDEEDPVKYDFALFGLGIYEGF